MISKKPLMCAGISAILLVFLPMILSLLGLIGWTSFFAIVSYLSSAILSFYFIYGFYHLGLKYKNKLLSVVSLVGIIFTVLFYLVMIFFSGSIESSFQQFNQTISQQQIVLDNLVATNASAQDIAVLENEMTNNALAFLGPYLFVFGIFLFFGLIYAVLFNVGLLKLKTVEYAKVTGILGLVSVGLTLTIFGILLAIPIMIAYYVLLIVILFSQAKKFKEIR